MDPGPCLNSLARYSYNSVTGQCEEFQYGGCVGNRNRFMRIEQCEEECRVAPTTSVAPQTTDAATAEPSPVTAATEAMTTSSGNVVMFGSVVAIYGKDIGDGAITLGSFSLRFIMQQI